LYKTNQRDGVAGYVRHVYNPKSFYQCAGNFFIGVGPILFGSAVLIFMLYLLVPETCAAMGRAVGRFAGSPVSHGVSAPLEAIGVLGEMFMAFFSLHNFADFRWWLCLVAGCSIALHLNLSRSDIDGALPGAGLFAALVVVVNALVAVFGWTADFHHGFLSACLYVIGALLFSLLFSLSLAGVVFVAVSLAGWLKKAGARRG
jgi:hypothetical protein